MWNTVWIQKPFWTKSSSYCSSKWTFHCLQNTLWRFNWEMSSKYQWRDPISPGFPFWSFVNLFISVWKIHKWESEDKRVLHYAAGYGHLLELCQMIIDCDPVLEKNPVLKMERLHFTLLQNGFIQKSSNSSANINHTFLQKI